jgi:hypothetical protein
VRWARVQAVILERRRISGARPDIRRGEDVLTLSGYEISSEDHAALLERARVRRGLVPVVAPASPAASAVDLEDFVADMVTARVLSTAPVITSTTATSSSSCDGCHRPTSHCVCPEVAAAVAEVSRDSRSARRERRRRVVEDEE